MAKSSEEKLLEALRKAMSGPVKLQGTPAASCLFGAKDKQLAQRAIAEGLIEKVETSEPFGKKGKTRSVDFGRLTQKGQLYVLEQDSPKAALADLCRVIQNQAVAIQAIRGDAAQWQADIGRAFRETLEQQVQRAVQTYQEQVDGNLAKWSNRLGQLQETLRSVEAIVTSVAEKAAVTATTHHEGSPIKENLDWLDDAVKMITHHKEHRRFPSLTLPALYEGLRASHPRLTLGQFHDGLRVLRDKRLIRLEPFTQALATLDDPRNALYLDREVKYYVDLP